jgi:hypothetical protein
MSEKIDQIPAEIKDFIEKQKLIFATNGHERKNLIHWIDKQDQEGIKNYQQNKNTVSFDGHPTKIFD